MLKPILTALVTSSLCLAACRGGAGGDSGVDGSKDLLSLSVEEIIEICEYGNSLVSEATHADLNCYSLAIFDASEGKDCEASYSECIANYQPFAGRCDAAADGAMPPACAAEVTVTDLEACRDARAVQTNAIRLSCELTLAELETIQNQPAPEECTALKEICPELRISVYF